jgi:hypothetical protein
MEKIVRSICYFTDQPNQKIYGRIRTIEQTLKKLQYNIQTLRICTSGKSIGELETAITDQNFFLSIGGMGRNKVQTIFDDFLSSSKNISLNLELEDQVTDQDVELLLRAVQDSPEKTFNFAYTFHNIPGSPFYPSSKYAKNGFSIGLQTTNLAKNCTSLNDWFVNLKAVWHEIVNTFKAESDFLGLDSSIAPIFDQESSLINFIRSLHGSFRASILTDSYIKITNFLKQETPQPIGLCGLMFPCLEDFDLAAEYEKGNFTLERNILLSLNSGLGVDTYPIGIDEDPQVIKSVLSLLLKLAQKYQKPLSARFVSDGRSKIGQLSDFKNQYLKDVKIRPLGIT